MIKNKNKNKNKIWFYTFFVLMVCTTFANAQTTIRYQKEMQGGATMVGNSWYYSLAATPTTRRVPNVDPVSSNTMSTSADLILPTGSKIEKVFLAIEKNGAPNFTSVKVKTPGNSTYTTLLAASSIANKVATGYAQMIWDITTLVPSNGYVSASGGGIGGRFYLANPLPVPTSMGGWSVIVVYSNPNSKFRSITVADDWQFFSSSTVNTNITGVKVPASGTVKAVVGVTGTFGDRGAIGTPDDYLNFGKTGTTLTSLKDPMTGSTSDALNSSIAWASTNNVTADGGPVISGNYTARNPISAGHFYNTSESWEFDADIFDASGIIAPSASPVNVTLSQVGTGNDQLASGSYFIAVDIAPPVSLTKAISPASIVDGGTATYTWTISNTGSGAVAQTISFTDTLPTKIKVASAPNITVTGGSTSSVTAASGSGSVQVSGLTLAAGASATIKVNITNVPGELNASCAANPTEFTNSVANITVPAGVLLDLSQLTPQCLMVTACNAGTSAPTVNTSVSNICPATTVNLNSQAHTGTVPGTSALVWFTNNAHTGTPYANPTTATAGTYYAFYYDSENGGCYSLASNPVTVTINNCPPPTPDDAFASGISVQPGGVLSSCGTAKVTGYFGFTGPIETGYNNANHWSEMAIMLPGFLYTRVPNDPGPRTEVNNETNFNLQMTVTSSDGVVYWDPPYIEADHSLKLVLKQDAVIPFGTIITWVAEGLEIDDAQNYNSTVGINIYHAAVDGDDTNNYMETPVSTTNFNSCQTACFNNPTISGLGGETKVGVTLLQRAGENDPDNWPMVRKSGFIALESNSQGFVVSRIAKANLGNIVSPQEGMMVYDTTDKCLKIYSDSTWKCFNVPSCP